MGLGGVLAGLLFLVGYYFLAFVLPKRAAKRKQKKFVAGLVAGDRVLTTAGIAGTIFKKGETLSLVEIAPNVRVEVLNEKIDRKLQEASGRVVAQQPSAPPSHSAEMRLCPRCQAPRHPDDRFCDNCGNELAH